MRVWVTRTEPGAAETARRVRDLGHEPVVEPLFDVRPVEAPLDLAGVQAIAFTSRNAVAAFAARSRDRSRTVFAVGDATARAAGLAGFAEVFSASGDVEALARLIAARLTPERGAVLHARGREVAGDLAGALADAGFEVRSVVVYETVGRTFVPPRVDAVLVHSPSAARRLAAGGNLAPAFACISEQAAAPLREAGAKKVLTAPFPDEAALLKLLSDPTLSDRDA